MITFNNELELARRSVLNWEGKGLLRCVTVVRDVFGRLSFLVDAQEYPEEGIRGSLEGLLERDLGKYFAKPVYWENMPAKKRRYLEPMIDLMKEGRKTWRVEQGVEFYLSERTIAKKAWVCQARQETVWPYEDALEGGKPKVVTFYSFKGGMGRTTTLASVALQMARKGKNVMMVDTDIEAPGLATLFLDEELIESGVLDYLLEYAVDGEADISGYVMDVADPALFRRLRGGSGADRDTLRAYTDALFEGYCSAFGNRRAALGRMKEIWFYQISLFDGAEKYEKKLKKAASPEEYRDLAARVFGELPLREAGAVPMW